MQERAEGWNEKNRIRRDLGRAIRVVRWGKEFGIRLFAEGAGGVSAHLERDKGWDGTTKNP